jgi:hypothetical protein
MLDGYDSFSRQIEEVCKKAGAIDFKIPKDKEGCGHIEDRSDATHSNFRTYPRFLSCRMTKTIGFRTPRVIILNTSDLDIISDILGLIT